MTPSEEFEQQKLFVNFKQALALKEIGFNEYCITSFNARERLVNIFATALEKDSEIDDCYVKNSQICIKYVTAPTYQQAFSFLRKKYSLESIIPPSGDSGGKTNGYYYEIIFDFSNENIESDTFATYEEAEEACLNKLIEIAKGK
jgi:hypothetical protein